MSETVRADTSGEAPLSSRWPKRLVIGGLVLLPFVALASAYIIIEIGGKWALQDAIAEADRLDPGWRLEELLEKREAIPDAENSARHILAVVGTYKNPTFPNEWPDEKR